MNKETYKGKRVPPDLVKYKDSMVTAEGLQLIVGCLLDKGYITKEEALKATLDGSI